MTTAPAKTELIIFFVDGTPVPKQSYRARKGGGYLSPRVTAWQNYVTLKAREAMQGREPFQGSVAVRLIFVLKNRRVVDLDNLSKGVLDGIKNIVFGDDSDVVNLQLIKHIYPQAQPGVMIEVREGELL